MNSRSDMDMPWEAQPDMCTWCGDEFVPEYTGQAFCENCANSE